MTKMKIISLDDTDDIVIKVGSKELSALISVAPYSIEEGKEYNGEISFYMFENFDLNIADVENRQITHIENYAYELTGKMIASDTIDVGFPITSEWIEDYSYLSGQYVTCRIDRLEVNFL